MIKIIAGRNAAYEVLIAAAGLVTGDDRDKTIKKVGDKDFSADGTPVFLGYDSRQQDIYVMGIPNYRLMPRIKQQLEWACGEKTDVTVLPFTTPGENTTAWLLRFSLIPLIGEWFSDWARNRVMRNKDKIMEQAKLLREEEAFQYESQAAAKPFPDNNYRRSNTDR